MIISYLHRLTIKYGPGVIFLLALLDASFLAMPVTTLFTMFILIKGSRINVCLLLVLAGTLAGAFAGYELGHLFLMKGEDWLAGMARPLMEHNTGFSVTLYYKIRSFSQDFGFWVLLVGTFTPIPYGMFAITAGMLNLNIISFMLMTLISHGIKYSVLSFLMIKVKDRIKSIVVMQKRRSAIVT